MKHGTVSYGSMHHSWCNVPYIANYENQIIVYIIIYYNGYHLKYTMQWNGLPTSYCLRICMFREKKT